MDKALDCGSRDCQIVPGYSPYFFIINIIYIKKEENMNYDDLTKNFLGQVHTELGNPLKLPEWDDIFAAIETISQDNAWADDPDVIADAAEGIFEDYVNTYFPGELKI